MARLLWGRIPIEKIAAFYYHYPKSASASIIYDMKYYNNPTLGYRIARMLVAEPDFQHFFLYDLRYQLFIWNSPYFLYLIQMDGIELALYCAQAAANTYLLIDFGSAAA